MFLPSRPSSSKHVEIMPQDSRVSRLISLSHRQAKVKADLSTLPLTGYTAAEGRLLGSNLLLLLPEISTIKARNLGQGTTVAVQELVADKLSEYQGIAIVTTLYPWFTPLITGILLNTFTLFPPSCRNDSSALAASDGFVISRGIGVFLIFAVSATQGVAAWVLKYPALQQLEHQYVWIRPMLNVIAEKCLCEATWGASARLFFGGTLSFLDMASDVTVVVEYMSRPASLSYAFMLLGCVALNLVLQACLVVVQTHRGPTGNMLMEVGIALSGMKPAVDASRVASSTDEAALHQTMPRNLELICTRCMELFGEAIPGCILQVYVMIQLMKNGDPVGTSMYVSLCISALTTGFMSATVSYDLDTDPHRRAMNPDFYGYVPDDAVHRILLFVCMMLNGAVFLIVRSISTAMLAGIGKGYLLYYTVADIGLYFAFKFARNDLYYWMPLEGGMGLIVTFMGRLLIKVITDYTGCVHFRAAVEMGGFYWTVNMVLSVVVSFASVWLYFDEVGDEGGLQQDFAWRVVGGVSIAWIVLFAIFMMVINGAYWGTFYSTQTGNAWAQQAFLDKAAGPEKRATEIISFNRHMWQSIREDVREYFKENWETWEEEAEDWFDEYFIMGVDDDLLPPAVLRREKMAHGGGERSERRRRSSIGGFGEGPKGNPKMSPTAVLARALSPKRCESRSIVPVVSAA